MAFSTVTKVQAMFRNLKLDAANSALTTAEIQVWLDEAYEEILSCLEQFYTMSSAGPRSLTILSKIETLKVAALVDDVLNNYSDAKLKPQYDKKADAILEKYIPRFNNSKCEWCDPEAKLPDTPYLGLPSSTTEMTVQSQGPATFKKGVDSW